MEQYRDIAVLMSMGARREQIRRIFMLQGVLIGVVGSAIGLVAGHALCYFAGKYHWIPLEEAVYSMSFVPFEAQWADAIWIAGLAVVVSFLATLYPAALRNQRARRRGRHQTRLDVVGGDAAEFRRVDDRLGRTSKP
jgi:lipoprotein-releasing system permease protein